MIHSWHCPRGWMRYSQKSSGYNALAGVLQTQAAGGPGAVRRRQP